MPEDDEPATDRWSLSAWTKGAGIHRVVAAVIQRAIGPQTDALSYLRSLGARKELAQLFHSDDFIEGVIDLLWPQVETLKQAGAATSDEIQSKFAGSIALSYSGLDTFFGGLEGVIGSPDPKLMKAMATEHTECGDSTDVFVTGNYGVETTSKTEWLFTAVGTATPEQAGLTRWPVESEAKLPDRDMCRSRRSVNDLLRGTERTKRDALLRAAGQPALVDEEVIAANLYTGPMFVKYNSVLRGLQAESPFLRNTMVQLCCPRYIFTAFIGSVPPDKLFLKAEDGSISFEEAVRWLNKYTTTLHGINSAIIKLGKLTHATKVYRGIAGMALPPEFWRPNEYGVRGGVEGAFMSTTTSRQVAMGYAAGGTSSKFGIVIEVQQGMVNRGADISWLSQYPHEREILFGPLTGIEVLNTHIDGSVIVIACSFSINLTALTLEQVLGKRRKVVEDMCEQLAVKARQTAQLEEWDALRPNGTSEVPAVEAFLKHCLMPLANQEPEHYNDNAPLGIAIQEAVAMADILDGWPRKLDALAKLAVTGKAEGSATIEELVQHKGMLALSLKKNSCSMEIMHGICALLWARSKDAPLSLALNEQLVSAECLAALGRAISPSLISLNLEESNCTNRGGNYSGIESLSTGIARSDLTITDLNLSSNDLKEEGVTAICKALQSSKGTALASLNISGNGIGPTGAKAVAAMVAVVASLTEVC